MGRQAIVDKADERMRVPRGEWGERMPWPPDYFREPVKRNSTPLNDVEIELQRGYAVRRFAEGSGVKVRDTKGFRTRS